MGPEPDMWKTVFIQYYLSRAHSGLTRGEPKEDEPQKSLMGQPARWAPPLHAWETGAMNS